MRTNTTTFAKHVFGLVRDLGINSVRSKQVARRISSAFSYGFYNPLGDFTFDAPKNIETIKLQLNISFSGIQGVDVIVDGEFAFRASTNDGILVNIEATPRQIEMAEELHVLMRATGTAISTACAAYNEEYGAPTSFEDYDKRDEYCAQDAGVIAARAAYYALRDESLAINPFAPGHIVDPRLAYTYADYHKEEYGCRPSGYANVADMQAYLARPYRESDDEDDVIAA